VRIMIRKFDCYELTVDDVIEARHMDERLASHLQEALENERNTVTTLRLRLNQE
jgi:Flp pilus assembly CpaF family ATPase